MEKYSVLMSLYKDEKAEYLIEAINSMINQTVKPDEIVVVFDGPLNDELYSTMNKFVDKYPKLFHIVENKKNLGLGVSLNKGLKECKNNLVARMDTDDISKSDRCEKQLKKFDENPELTIVGAHIDEFIGIKDYVVSSRKVPLLPDEIYEYAKRRSAFNHPVVMYKRDDILKEKGYSDLRRNQDVELFGRLMFKGYKAENLDESLLWFRVNDDLTKRRKSWENTKSYINTIKKFWKMGYSNFFDYLIVKIAQTVLFCIPYHLQNKFYNCFLRKK